MCITALQHTGIPAEPIQNFGITNEAARIKLAEMVAAKAPMWPSMNIQSFGISNEAIVKHPILFRGVRLGLSLNDAIKAETLADLKKKSEDRI